MLATTEKLQDSGFGDKLFTDKDLLRIFDGTPASRYSLVNKALKKKEWVRLSRGLYILNTKYRTATLSKFYIASRMVHGSYVSTESALSYHGFIPERVETITSIITQGRTHTLHTSLGTFQYSRIPVNEYEFLTGVLRRETNDKPFLIASPLRALADYVYINKIEWTNLGFLIEGLRIEEEDLLDIPLEDYSDIMKVYRSKRVLTFLKNLKKALRK